MVRGVNGQGDGLTIRCFGALALERAGRLLPFPTRRAKSLFAYLILHRGRPRPREAVCGALWDGEPDAIARKRLRTELWRLRRAGPLDELCREAAHPTSDPRWQILIGLPPRAASAPELIQRLGDLSNCGTRIVGRRSRRR